MKQLQKNALMSAALVLATPGLAESLVSFEPTAKASLERSACTPTSAGNPFVDGWYADPDMKNFDGTYWVYPTYSAPFEQQTFLDAFSSPDLIHWTKHERVLDRSNVSWATYAIWAPSPIFRKGKYYLYFGANTIGSSSQLGGIGVATADNPAGPFIDPLGRPLINDIVNNAQPIDQNVFIDDDGKAYIYYGGWGRCNVARLNDDMTSLGTLPDGNVFKEITPPGYTEGPLMFKRKGVYYLMWSEGEWFGPDYRVAYGTSNSPLGPFEKKGVILGEDHSVGTGSGHNTVVNVPGTDEWYIVYHRHPLSDPNGHHRVLAYDSMVFNEDGSIRPVVVTNKDNFCDGNAIGWKTYAGNWRISGEQFIVDSNLGSNALQNVNYTQFEFNADVSVGASGNAGLLYRVSAQTEGSDFFRGYMVGLDAAGDRLFVGKSDGTSWQELGAVQTQIDAGVMYSLRVVAVGSRMEVYFNNATAPSLTINDGSFGAGAIGLRSYSANAHFDNIEVRAL